LIHSYKIGKCKQPKSLFITFLLFRTVFNDSLLPFYEHIQDHRSQLDVRWQAHARRTGWTLAGRSLCGHEV